MTAWTMRSSPSRAWTPGTKSRRTHLKFGSDELKDLLTEEQYSTLSDDIELLSGAGDEFDLDAVHHGKLSPVFFGSALTNFGVEPFLKKFLVMTPPPTARQADIGVIDPFEDAFFGLCL